MLWMSDASQQVATLPASRGYDFQGAGAEISVGEGLVGTAVREGVPIRVGHMMNMATYMRAVRERAGESGLNVAPAPEIPLPGLKEPRSQLAVPLRARGRVLGALLVGRQPAHYFVYDDEDAVMLLCGQFAGAMTLMHPQAQDAPAPVTGRPAPVGQGPALR